MKQKTIKFGSYWLKTYIYTGSLRIDGGLNEFQKHPKKQTTCMLASSDSQLEKISEMGRAMTSMADDILLQRKKKKKWFED